MQSPAADFEEIKRSVALFLEPGAVIELRVPKAGRDGTISGYFANPDQLARAAAAVDGKGPGIYVTLNPVMPDLLARASGRLKSRADFTTSDGEILRRRCLLLDFDPRRPAGISS